MASFCFTLQASKNVPEEIDRLHHCIVGVVNNVAIFFEKSPVQLSMTGALVTWKFVL